MPFEINAQFNQFVRFAQRQADGETVARTAPAPDGAGPLAGRAVTAERDDKFAAFKRSAEMQARNNETRAIFRESVNAIFGGAGNLPPSVREAMQLGDYDNKGKPLLARNILAVQKAILLYKAEQEVDRAVEHLTDLLLSSLMAGGRFRPIAAASAQHRAAVRITAKFARNLSGKGIRLLANCVTLAIAQGCDAEAVAADIQRFFAPVSGIRPEDGRGAEFERKLLARARERLAEAQSRRDGDPDDPDGVSGAFGEAGPKNPVSIDGKDFPDGASAAEAFKAAIKPGHRRAIAGFFARMDNAPVTAVSGNSAPPGASDGSLSGPWSVEVAGPKRSIAVSEDGKRATLSVETPGRFAFAVKGEGGDASLPVGGIVWKQEYDFDLDGPEAVLTAARFGQDLDV